MIVYEANDHCAALIGCQSLVTIISLVFFSKQAPNDALRSRQNSILRLVLAGPRTLESADDERELGGHQQP